MKDVAKRIAEKATQIRHLVQDRSTTSVVGWTQSFNLRSANDGDWHKVLHSPARQISFLLGLFLSSPEPEEAKELTREEWETVLTLLNATFDEYQALYYPSEAEAKELGPDWWRAREVAMPSFIHYAFSDVMASTEQVGDRISRYLGPYDSELESELGVSATEAHSVASVVLQKSLAYGVSYGRLPAWDYQYEGFGYAAEIANAWRSW